MKQERLHYLFGRHESGGITATEQEELLEFLADYGNREMALEYLENELRATPQQTLQREEKWQQIIQRIVQQPAAVVRPLFSWKKMAVAASIVLALAAGAYFAFFQSNKKQQEVAEKTAVEDVEAPKITKATITLSNGSTVALDSFTALMQGDVKLHKTADGKLIYSPKDRKTGSQEVAYNTLTNPRGSKVIDMQLADGSHVWLNAGSSVTYPVAFIGSERKVQITGEAYFDVVHDKTKPFYVSKDEMKIEVLGTKFNVNAYDDESDIKVTLLQGSVKVLTSSDSPILNSYTLKPGQQVRQTKNNLSGFNGKLQIVNSPDLDEVMAWKNGDFYFESADLGTILREFSRWYDVEVVYENPIKNRNFFGIIKRSSTLRSVLEMLQDNNIGFHIEGQRLIVKSE